MRTGRPPLGVEHVEGLEGDERQKERLKAILATLAGELTIEEACERLRVGESRFHVLRHEVLQSALDRLAPRAPGRKPKVPVVELGELEELQRDNDWLREELELARVRTEIALVMPHLLREPHGSGKSSARAGRRRGRSGGAKSGITRG